MDTDGKTVPAASRDNSHSGSAGVSPANFGFWLPTSRRDASAPRRFMARVSLLPNGALGTARPTPAPQTVWMFLLAIMLDLFH